MPEQYFVSLVFMLIYKFDVIAVSQLDTVYNKCSVSLIRHMGQKFNLNLRTHKYATLRLRV